MLAPFPTLEWLGVEKAAQELYPGKASLHYGIAEVSIAIGRRPSFNLRHRSEVVEQVAFYELGCKAFNIWPATGNCHNPSAGRFVDVISLSGTAADTPKAQPIRLEPLVVSVKRQPDRSPARQTRRRCGPGTNASERQSLGERQAASAPRPCT